MAPTPSGPALIATPTTDGTPPTTVVYVTTTAPAPPSQPQQQQQGGAQAQAPLAFQPQPPQRLRPMQRAASSASLLSSVGGDGGGNGGGGGGGLTPSSLGMSLSLSGAAGMMPGAGLWVWVDGCCYGFSVGWGLFFNKGGSFLFNAPPIYPAHPPPKKNSSTTYPHQSPTPHPPGMPRTESMESFLSVASADDDDGTTASMAGEGGCVYNCVCVYYGYYIYTHTHKHIYEI